MNHQLSLILVLMNGLMVGAQTVNLRGAITSGGGQPVSGAIVTLLKLNLKDTTGADGTYAISKTISAISPGPSGDGLISFSGRALELELAESAPVVIEIFDIKSNLLKVENRGVQGAGHYSWNIPGEFGANKLLIVRASVGDRVSTFRCMPSSGYAGRAAFLKSPSEGRAMAKSAAAVDSLEISASGYATKTVMVESFDAQLNVSLTAVDNSGDRWGGLKNPPAKSAGCGKATTLTNGIKTMGNRDYSLDFPTPYDMNAPHMVIFIYHWAGGSAASMKNNNYYGIQPLATAAKVPAIFVAPTHSASAADHVIHDDILTLLKANLCVDSSRVFTTGYSLGGMMTYSLTQSKQKKLRAGAGIAAAIISPTPKIQEPIAYFGLSAMGDQTCIWDGGNGRGSKYIILEKAKDNGCTIPATDFPVWKSGIAKHVVYEFEGCKPGYPVVQSTFDGPHGKAEVAKDPGESASWVPKEIWAFFTRF